MKIRITVPTYLKNHPFQISDERVGGIRRINPGELEITKLNTELVNGHISVGLPSSEFWGSYAYIFAGHVQLPEPENLSFARISQKGIDLIKEFEGLELTSYLCPANVWTVGFGHTKTARKGQKISAAGAEDLLRVDLSGFEAAVTDSVKVPITQNQFDALVCFTYNVGIGALLSSTLLKKLNAGDYAGASLQFLRWDKGGGKILPGLTRRRIAESQLFLSK